MRIYLLNLRKFKGLLGFFKIVSISLVIVILSSFLLNTYADSLYASAMAEENDRNLVIIDAGHGGEDPGAISANGVYEKNLNLEIAMEIGERLTERGFAVVYTRLEDKLLYTEEENIKGIRKISDLKNRCKIAAEYPNSVFVSIHMNSYGSPKYSGLQVYYSEKNEKSRTLANSIQATVKHDVQNENNRVTKPGKDIYLLKNTPNVSVLIECGFLSNPEEAKKLSEKEYQKRLSSAIVCGIIKYKGQIN